MPALAVSEDTQADIFIAARTGELQELKEAVQQIQPEALIQVVNEYTKATPLHYAAANGHVGKSLSEVFDFVGKKTIVKFGSNLYF